jgi:hypothetical protein
MRIGFGKIDITPRVGVEMAGFGPFLNRHSIAVRDRLFSRAIAVEQDGQTAVIVSCDLIGLYRPQVARIREIVADATGLSPAQVFVHCTHTHSAPSTGSLNGWGDPDMPYLEVLPGRVAQAVIDAVANLQPATLSHAEVPCEGIGLNREWDIDAPPLDEVLREDWRPAHPEWTDTTCQVLSAHTPKRPSGSQGELLGFASYFGCHPVVMCQECRYLSGDFVGVATNLLEREHPGSTGLFLQGAQGDVNSCCVHKPEQEALLALDVIAARYARAVRLGLREAQPIEIDTVRFASHQVDFTRRDVDLAWVRERIAAQEAIIYAPGASDADYAVRLATVYALGLRSFLSKTEAALPQALSLSKGALPTEIHGLRFGPLTILGSPFEMFQEIKNDVRREIAARSPARSPLTMVCGITDDELGYAPDRKTMAARADGYAAYEVALILGIVPFANIHDELVAAFLDVESALL